MQNRHYGKRFGAGAHSRAAVHYGMYGGSTIMARPRAGETQAQAIARAQQESADRAALLASGNVPTVSKAQTLLGHIKDRIWEAVKAAENGRDQAAQAGLAAARAYLASGTLQAAPAVYAEAQQRIANAEANVAAALEAYYGSQIPGTGAGAAGYPTDPTVTGDYAVTDDPAAASSSGGWLIPLALLGIGVVGAGALALTKPKKRRKSRRNRGR